MILAINNDWFLIINDTMYLQSLNCMTVSKYTMRNPVKSNSFKCV